MARTTRGTGRAERRPSVCRTRVRLAAVAVGGLVACSDDAAGPESGATVDDLQRVEARIARLGQDFGMFSDQFTRNDDPGDVSDDITQDIDGVPDLLGESVTVSGEITSVIDQHGVLISGDGDLDPTASVLLPTARILVVGANVGGLTEGEVVRIDGVVAQYDTSTFEDELGIELDRTRSDIFEGEVALRADTVITDVPTEG